MKKVKSILLLGILGGLAWVGFSFYKVKYGSPVFSLEFVHDYVERYLNSADLQAQPAATLSPFLHENEGHCKPVNLPEPGGSSVQKPIPSQRFSFAQTVLLQNAGVQCEFPGFGNEITISQAAPQTAITLRRRWKNPPALFLDQGGVQIRSSQLHLEWRVPGMQLELRSEGQAQLELRHHAGMIYLNLQSGKLSLAVLRKNFKKDLPLPIQIVTAKDTALTSGGAPVAANGESIRLLPSGFTEKASGSAP